MFRYYTYTDTPRPPRQATPATPPQEGNVPILYLYRHATTTPSGYACHPSTGGECSDTILIQTRHDHPVRLRLPPLHRRGMFRYYTYTDTPRPPRQATPATPPQEGNVPTLYLTDTPRPPRQATPATPSTGGECSDTILIQTRHDHPVRLRLPPLHRRGMFRYYTYTDTPRPPRQATPATPPQEGNVPILYLYRHATTTPSGYACHPSTGGECSDTILIQTRHDHPVRLRLPPFHRRGMFRYYTYTDTPRPPRQATPATPPQERNVPILYLYRHATTTPSGYACHPSTGGECSDTILNRHATTTPSGYACTPPQEGN